ncbi:MAG: hypothetical protein LCH91_18590 [Bacteroidetes bacterium]|nr:hypothetical protein [Bacteroidota bacterium]
MLKNILIHIRDFCYHFSKKQGGEKFALENYKLRLLGFVFIYYIGLLVVIGNIAHHYNKMPINKNSSFLGRISFSLFFFLLPSWLLLKWILKTVEDSPIKIDISLDEYRKIRNRGLFILVFGFVFCFSCLVLPTYIRGGKIHIGNYVIQSK